MGISTHILDTTRGRPASGVKVTLEKAAGPAFEPIGGGETDADGRVKGLHGGSPEPGNYRITFHVAAYFEALGVPAFYPEMSIVFTVAAPGQHYHVPLL